MEGLVHMETSGPPLTQREKKAMEREREVAKKREEDERQLVLRSSSDAAALATRSAAAAAEAKANEGALDRFMEAAVYKHVLGAAARWSLRAAPRRRHGQSALEESIPLRIHCGAGLSPLAYE